MKAMTLPPYRPRRAREGDSLLHVAVAGADVAQDRAQLAQVRAGLLGRAQAGLGDDLHQRDARAVEIDERRRRVAVVEALAGVLLEVQPGDADRAGGAVRHVEDEFALADDRLAVLRDLYSPPAGRVRSSSSGRTPSIG